jgi:hypothetical protein
MQSGQLLILERLLRNQSTTPPLGGGGGGSVGSTSVHGGGGGDGGPLRHRHGLTHNELQLRLASKARCFIAPHDGASYVTFYQPGLHVMTDVSGRERCNVLPTREKQRGRSGTLSAQYYHHYTRLAGEDDSIIYNVEGSVSELRKVLEVMCTQEVCDDHLAGRSAPVWETTELLPAPQLLLLIRAETVSTNPHTARDWASFHRITPRAHELRPII